MPSPEEVKRRLMLAGLAKLAPPVDSLRASADQTTKTAGSHFESALGAAFELLRPEDAPENWRLLLSRAAVYTRLGVGSLGEGAVSSNDKIDAFCASLHEHATHAPDFETALNAIARSELLHAYVPSSVTTNA